MRFSWMQAVSVAATASLAAAENWAVIIASSCGYDNYRHQADAHHAYQILVEQGMDPERIIFIACDDIAYHEDNPFPGEIFNEPTGDNVYDPDIIDYRGDQVNAETFMAVMMGDKKAAGGGKVLRSTIEDNVFLFFVDHGAPGILAFPGPDEKHPFSFFYADQMMDTLEYMYTHRMYKDMLIYVEACEAGSMFVDLPDDMNIYAMTASDEEVSSWAIYCDEEAIIEGKDLGTCLGDLFSINWMTDVLLHSGKDRNLYAQYEFVKNETAENEALDRKGSPVCVYGDMNLQERDLVHNFIGNGQEEGKFQRNGLTAKAEETQSMTNQILGYLLGFTPKLDVSDQPASKWDQLKDSHSKKPKVNSRDAKLHFLMGRYNSNQGLFSHDKLASEIRHRMALDTAFFSLFPDIYEVEGPSVTAEATKQLHSESLKDLKARADEHLKDIKAATGDSEEHIEEKLTHQQKVLKDRPLTVPKDFDCLRFLMESFEEKCMPFSEYGLGHVKYIVEFCETKSTSEIVEKAMDMSKICNRLIV